MIRQVNAAAFAIVDSAEGCVLTAYRDPVGRLTAGRGHTGSDVVSGRTYAPAQCDAWEASDMARASSFVERRVKVALTDNQFSALAAFTFNVGVGNFAGSTLLRLLNRGDYAAVPAELMRWNKGRVGGRAIVLPGLTRRRAQEAKLFRTPDSEAVTIAATPATAIVAKPVPPSLAERLRAWLHGAVVE